MNKTKANKDTNKDTKQDLEDIKALLAKIELNLAKIISQGF